MTLGLLAARPTLEAFGPGARLALGVGLGAAAFTLAWLALPGGRASVSGLLNELRTALRPAAAAAPS